MKRLLLFAIIAIFAGCKPEAPDQTTEHKVQDLKLPPKYQKLLTKEMLLIREAMQQLMAEITEGQAQPAVQRAEDIHKSFILKQRLSSPELKELLSYLPPAFIKLDREFHGRAKTLAGQLKKEDFDGATITYNQMVQDCTTCHSFYARGRFPRMFKNSGLK